LKNPVRFTEKIQWYKINYRNALMPVCVDKYAVREYVISKNLSSTLNTLYGVYDDAEDIDFVALPDKFVIKINDGSAGENMFFCLNKNRLYIPILIVQLKKWKNKIGINAGREWAYTKIKKKKYIVEKYLENPVNPELGIEDYKLFCFHGKVEMIQVDIDRFDGHKRNLYDANRQFLDIVHTYPNFDQNRIDTNEFSNLIIIAEQLSQDFPFVRVDLYLIKGHVYFGELTFYPGSGYEGFVPDQFDIELGSYFRIF
jgi:hypothetical protein